MAPVPSNRPIDRSARAASTQLTMDEGLRAYMLRVYNYMGAGLALTGAITYIAAASGLYASIPSSPLIWLVVLAPLAFVPN